MVYWTYVMWRCIGLGSFIYLVFVLAFVLKIWLIFELVWGWFCWFCIHDHGFFSIKIFSRNIPSFILQLDTEALKRQIQEGTFKMEQCRKEVFFLLTFYWRSVFLNTRIFASQSSPKTTSQCLVTCLTFSRYLWGVITTTFDVLVYLPLYEESMWCYWGGHSAC